MIYTMLKSSFLNEEPKFLNYRVYKTFPYENLKGGALGIVMIHLMNAITPLRLN